MPVLAPSSEPAVVTVAPTNTTVLEVDTRFVDVLTVQLTNTDGTQTFAGTVQRRTHNETAFADSDIPDFSGVGPGVSVMADLDTRGSAVVRLVGYMSGAGGDVRVSYVRRVSP